jgi:serine/threonine protein kinase
MTHLKFPISTGEGTRVQTDPLGLSGKVLLGRYRVETALAQGGMSVIYRARDTRMLRAVCIKVFHRLCRDDAAYRTSHEHFVQEAFALSQLCHPNTLRIYDFGHLEDDTQAPFQVSELLEGGTLAQWVRREGPRRPAEALAILEPICGALVEAHARGIVHRDVKPANIMLALLGTRRVAKLGDFGIAKVLAHEPALPHRAGDTMASAGRPMFLFSPGWAAPEQIRGEQPTPATDVFSLGLVTAFVLGGHAIFASNDAVCEAAQRADSNGHLTAMLSRLGLSTKLQEVLRKACRESARERYGSVEEFCVALRDALTSVEAESGSSPWLELVAESGPLSGGTLLSSPDPCRQGRQDDSLASVAIDSEGTPAPIREALARAVVDCQLDRETRVHDRRLSLVGVPRTGQIELGGTDQRLPSRARFRLTFLPSMGPLPRINVKGLNCFVARVGGRATAAVDIEGDAELELLSPERKKLDGLRCTMGELRSGQHVYQLGNLSFALTGAEAGAVLIEASAGRELVLVHRAGSSFIGGQP